MMDLLRSTPSGKFLVWLDDLEGFLGQEGMNTSLLAALARMKVAVVATMQDDLFETYSNPKQDKTKESSLQIGNRLLRAVTPIRIARLWSSNEIRRASRVSDDRLAEAITHSATFGISEYLAAGPALMKTWRSAERVGGNPRGAALVQASVDLARAGFNAAVDLEVLEELHFQYLPSATLRPESWTDAKKWATDVQYGVSGLLVPGEDEGTWRAFDYLPDAISRDKANRRDIPKSIWNEALNLCPDDDDRWLIGMRAYMAGENDYAIAAWEPLAESGNGSAASNLASIYLEIGDHEAARYWRYIESQDGFHTETLPLDPSVPLYDPETGMVTTGKYRDGTLVQIPLHRPGRGVTHGVIAGGRNVGKSNSLTIILLGALMSGKYVLWLMDWAPSQKHFKPLRKSGAIDWFSGNDLERSLNILKAAVGVMETRTKKGDYGEPTAEFPAILVAIEEAQHLFTISDEASLLSQRIAREGSSVGVSIFLTLPDVSPKSFGGRIELQEAITADSNVTFAMGAEGLSMLRDRQNAPMEDSDVDPFL
ncbi:tetratricopeptide repeat protein [Streptomyces sp. NPDC054849]